MHQNIDLPEISLGPLGDMLDLVILGNVTRLDKGAANGCSQGAHAPFQSFTGITQPQASALFVKSFGNSPGNRAFIRYAENS